MDGRPRRPDPRLPRFRSYRSHLNIRPSTRQATLRQMQIESTHRDLCRVALLETDEKRLLGPPENSNRQISPRSIRSELALDIDRNPSRNRSTRIGCASLQPNGQLSNRWVACNAS